MLRAWYFGIFIFRRATLVATGRTRVTNVLESRPPVIVDYDLWPWPSHLTYIQCQGEQTRQRSSRSIIIVRTTDAHTHIRDWVLCLDQQSGRWLWHCSRLSALLSRIMCSNGHIPLQFVQQTARRVVTPPWLYCTKRYGYTHEGGYTDRYIALWWSVASCILSSRRWCAWQLSDDIYTLNINWRACQYTGWTKKSTQHFTVTINTKTSENRVILMHWQLYIIKLFVLLWY